MYFRHINTLYLLLFFISCLSLNAQISLVPLEYSHIISEASKNQTLERKKSSLDTLPFVDDFALKGPFPNTDLWIDNDVYVNSTFAIDPPSIGVATFDGIDNTGSPYDRSGQGDTLTSVGINLDIPNINNLFLSYYVQEKGFGNGPESNDSLILEFKTDTDDWIMLRSYNGSGASGDEFLFDSVEIVSPNYLFDDFQFRFRNTSANDGGGAVDMWHLDMVRIINNQLPSQTYKDLAFQYPTQSILNRYSAMPVKHFKSGTDNHLRDTFTFSIINHFDVGVGIGSPESLMSINEINSEEEVLSPRQYLTNISDLNIGSDTSKTVTVVQDFEIDASIFNNEDDLEFETLFVINPVVNDNEPGLLNNNFLRNSTIISDYFAYDDGSAESGIKADGPGTQIAIEFQTSVADTISAIQMHFPFIIGDVSDQFFNLKVWVGSKDTEPVFEGLLLNTVYASDFVDTLQGFTTYRLEDTFTGELMSVPVPANTNFYIGWENVTTLTDFTLTMPVGVDLSATDAGKYQFFKTIETDWQSLEEANFPGAILMRPVMGVDNAIYTSTSELEKGSYTIYPNPTTGVVNIESRSGLNLSGLVDVFDIQGRLVHRQTMQDQKVQLEYLPAGIYLIHLSDQNKNVLHREKLIIQPK